MSATKKTQLLETEEPEPVNNTTIIINITVNDGGSVTIQNEPKENPPKPPGSGG